VLLGSHQWLQQEGLNFPPRLWRAIEEIGGGDASVSAVGWGGRVRGAFVFREQLRDDAASALIACRRQGIHVAVATGDRAPRAAKLADLLHVPVLAEQLPEGKVAAVHDLRRRHGSCAMVGDGINDAPALAASDVGVAMGCGADLSRDAASVCLLSNDLDRLPWTIDLARQTVRVIRQNLCWAFSYNVVGIGLAASGQLNPVFAAVAMVASSALVITNSLRLNRYPEIREKISDCGTQRVPGIADLEIDNPESRVPSGCRNPQSELQLTP
jgi:P-type E1-E2 ATPase